jgi:hypothetical protein
MDFEGSCHCGAIGYVMSTVLAPPSWSVRCCQCSFCRAHGARCTSDPAGSVRLRVQDERSLVRYRFGPRSADFLVCSTCGVYIGAVLTSAHGTFATVNVNALAADPKGMCPPVAVDYGSESIAARVERRERTWTPVERGP